MTSLDMSEVLAWARVLERAGDDVVDEGKKVVAKGSLNVKNEARQLAPRGPHIPSYASSIGYDVTTGAGWIEGEIGPVKGRRQWGLGNLLEYGSANNPPHPHHEPALDHEEPRFIAACEALAAELVTRHG